MRRLPEVTRQLLEARRKHSRLRGKCRHGHPANECGTCHGAMVSAFGGETRWLYEHALPCIWYFSVGAAEIAMSLSLDGYAIAELP